MKRLVLVITSDDRTDLEEFERRARELAESRGETVVVTAKRVDMGSDDAQSSKDPSAPEYWETQHHHIRVRFGDEKREVEVFRQAWCLFAVFVRWRQVYKHSEALLQAARGSWPTDFGFTSSKGVCAAYSDLRKALEGSDWELVARRGFYGFRVDYDRLLKEGLISPPRKRKRKA